MVVKLEILKRIFPGVENGMLHLADDKAGMVEIDRKRALKRRDLIIALKGGHEIVEE